MTANIFSVSTMNIIIEEDNFAVNFSWRANVGGRSSE